MQNQPSNDAPLASARCGMVVLAGDGRWQAVNPALCRLLGEQADALAGTAAHRRLFPDIAARIDAALAGQGGPLRLEQDLPASAPGNAQRLRLELVAMPAHRDAPPQWLLQVHDTTAEHEARNALDAVRGQLEQLAYGISHDLRASLRGIEGFAERLQGQTLDAEGQDQLARIRAAAARADGLTRALVALTHAASAAYAEDEVDLSLLVDWTIAEMRDADPGRAVEVAVQRGMRVRGDERQLKLLLEQLLRNAWTFTAPQAAASIDVAARERDDRFELCVADNGIGFDMRYADRLFVPFRRLHRSEEGAGHGLGLAIVRTIAERHGGRVWATSEPGAGSRFFVELPVAGAKSGP
jgi:signal transduction histidine kinase